MRSKLDKTVSVFIIYDLAELLALMLRALQKLNRKNGVLLRGGIMPVLDRWRLSKRDKNRFRQENLEKEGFYSQNGQDKWAAETIFNRSHAGFFVEIGAYNGVSISNTCYLERQLGWSGICVEPVPKLFSELKHNRKCICLQACITAKDGEVEFIEVEGCEAQSALATALERTQDPRAVGQKLNRMNLPGHSLNTLFHLHGIRKVDFMSIDTEGSEMEILRNFDWNEYEIKVLCIENIYFGDLLAEFLYKRGYRLNAILGSDEIYVRG